MSLSKLQEMVKDVEAWHTAVHGITKSWTRLSDWTTMTTTTTITWVKVQLFPRISRTLIFKLGIGLGCLLFPYRGSTMYKLWQTFSKSG